MQKLNNQGAEGAKHQEFLIADIMPRREVHLICGPSGVGKTNLSLAGLKALQSGGEWLGRRILRPVRIFYISVDRSKESVLRAFDRHRIPQDSFPWTVEEDIPRGTGTFRVHDILSWVHDKYPEIEFVFIDGFASLLGGNLNEYQTVLDFLRVCRKCCEKRNFTVLGSVHSPKMRSDEFIPNPRQRVMGSAAWAGFSDLIIVLDPEDEEDTENPNRICRVLPRDAAEYVLHFRNESGILVPIVEADSKVEARRMEKEIESAPIGTTWSTSELQSMLGAPKASFHRWLSFAVAKGDLVRKSRGTYQRFG